MVYLPQELLSEVLSRLPVKSLLRFKCVSELWLHLIDSPNFVELHLHRQKQDQQSPNLKIMTTSYDYERRFYAWDFGSLNDTIKFEFTNVNYPISEARSLSVLGTCNGIICLKHFEEKSTQILFCNPLTRKYRQGPVLNNELHHHFGFGYDQKSQDYKLVVVSIFCRIYSLKSDSWISKPVKHVLKLRGNALFFNGALHWIAGELDTPYGRDSVVSIDLETGEWAEQVLLPKPASGYYYGLVVLCGCLCALSSGKFLDIWVMKNEGDNKSWNKLFSIAENDGFRSEVSVWPLAYVASARQLLMFDRCYHRQFVWYHVDKNRVENVDIRGGLYVDAFVYCESLVTV